MIFHQLARVEQEASKQWPPEQPDTRAGEVFPRSLSPLPKDPPLAYQKGELKPLPALATGYHGLRCPWHTEDLVHYQNANRSLACGSVTSRTFGLDMTGPAVSVWPTKAPVSRSMT